MATARRFLPVLSAAQRSASPSGRVDDPLLDNFARRVRYLRISVVDRCNYRCAYCMPEALGERISFVPRAQLLTFEEIARLVRVFAGLGVRKLRLTGGEPTVRNGIVDLVRMVAEVPGIEQVVMTSNGHLLGELARPLADAGLAGINISLDTLDADRFRAITGRGDVTRVRAGIDAAVAAGLRVKINAVALAGVNDDELAELCAFAWERGATPRFIEHMPMSDGALYDRTRGIGAAAIRAQIEGAFGALDPVASDRDGGPARLWALRADPARRFGVISAMTEHFCDACNRLRLTATGDLHACLGHDDATGLRDIMRAGGDDAAVTRAIASAVAGKRAGHEFDAAPPAKHMIGIGG